MHLELLGNGRLIKIKIIFQFCIISIFGCSGYPWDKPRVSLEIIPLDLYSKSSETW